MNDVAQLVFEDSNVSNFSRPLTPVPNSDILELLLRIIEQMFYKSIPETGGFLHFDDEGF